MIKVKIYYKLLIISLSFTTLIFASPHYTDWTSTNALIRSGNLADIENTPIYSNQGVSYSVGGVGDIVFDVTARLQSALVKLDSGQSPAVKDNWSTTEEYEEWTDRLILRKTTDFYVLDGAQFAQSFCTRACTDRSLAGSRRPVPPTGDQTRPARTLARFRPFAPTTMCLTPSIP